ncbi:MAG TPA: TIGR04282 family arsenosugar biosynthesis glycosyltransferase [Solirubrobacteraceae bacterium]|nr:TIGR04282 family arsenosugar biosynthesis glycosyltransferase [Solirubrobacteraceae bacterium]
MSRPAAIVIAKAPRPGLCKTRLEPLLGPEGCARLQAALVARAAAWAADVGDPYVVFTPGDAREEIAALAPGATLVPQADGTLGDRLAGAFRHVLAEHPGPALLVGVDTPQLSPAHAAAALGDLEDGIDVTVGPAADGGYYLIGLREPCDAVFDLPAELWGGPEVLFRTLEAADRAGLSVAMLRSERDLDEEGDVRALLADPLTPPDICACLGDRPDA